MLNYLLLQKVSGISKFVLSSSENIYCQTLKIPPPNFCIQVMLMQGCKDV